MKVSQSPTMDASIAYAKGEYIVTKDNALQNGPADIPALLEKLKNEDIDLMAGIWNPVQRHTFNPENS